MSNAAIWRESSLGKGNSQHRDRNGCVFREGKEAAAQQVEKARSRVAMQVSGLEGTEGL